MGPKIVHEPIDVTPPRKPLDIIATVNDVGTASVTLFYRRSGEAEFTSKPMQPHGSGLIARIPGKLVGGKGLQYYIEARDAAGGVIARSGKSTSPHVVLVESHAKPRFTTEHDEPDETLVEPKRDDSENPVVVAPRPAITDEPATPSEPWLHGRRLTIAKWSATAATGVLVGASVVSFLVARRQADNLVSDSRSCGTPPCREFDAEYGQGYQTVGERYDLVYKVTLGLGVAAAGVAGYLWYRDLKSARRADEEGAEAASRSKRPRRRVVVAPALGDGFAGAAIGGEL